MRKVRTESEKVKRALRAKGVTYEAVAKEANVSWFMVWAVINGRKKSSRVMAAVQRLLSEDAA